MPPFDSCLFYTEIFRLHKIWINKKDEDNSIGDDPQNAPENGLDREESAASSVSLGDTHIWRDNGDANV